jgi:hypothetical protein
MAITVTEVRQVRKFNYSDQNKSGRSTYDVFFQTGTNAEYADYVKKLNMCFTASHPGGAGDITDTIPQYGEQLTNGVQSFEAFVTNVTPKVYKGQNNWWRVTVEYGAAENESDEEQFNDDPENIAPNFSWGQQSVQRTIYIDKTTVADGGPLPVVNSAGEGFSSLPKVEDSFLTLTVTRRTTAYDPLLACDLINHLNDANLVLDGTTFPKGTVKLVAWKAQKKTALVSKPGITPYFKTFYDEVRTYHIKKDGWLGEVYDQGTKENLESGASGRGPGLVVIRRFGEPIRKPVPLNGLGEAIHNEKGTPVNIPVDQPVIGLNNKPGVKAMLVNNVTGDKVAMLLFNFYEYANLGVLGDS